ncbi:LysM peptidoglycan-binding domain-containing protein [Cytophagaceae bacterium ABcell3]|nr:LysM peptidoglycan-binding domain-containing protein [Cytophagaceae bacterium ABcell3]
MKYILLLTLLVCSFLGYGQEVYIPERMTFANMELTLTSQVRKVLKSEVEAITRNPKYFNIKVERANLYFPIIEKVFKDEDFPDDFKYLALQESSLISDAVSSSNAVGYWQFKKEAAREVGLRIDNEVDERINIVSATRGAARYLRKNNSILDNWIYALLSYNLGPGGVRSHVDNKYVGARKMTIDKNMHWYVVRFLAHKIAYENEVGKAEHPELKLVKYTKGANMSLKEIAKETNVALEDLEMYNKWILKSKVPDDKVYAVILPVKRDPSDLLAYQSDDDVHEDVVIEDPEHQIHQPKERGGFFRRLFSRNPKPENEHQTIVNNLKAIKAKEGESFEQLAERGGVGLIDIIKYNELRKRDEPVPGEYYYLQPKRGKALVIMHTVEKGETIWDVAHKYGIRTRAIRKKNRMDKYEPLKPGRVLWLRNKMPKDAPIQFVDEKKNYPNGQDKQQRAPEGNTYKDAPSYNSQVNKVPEEVEEPYMDEAYEEEIVDYYDDEDGYAQDGSSFVEGSYKYHLVEPGQTVYALSRKYNVPVDSIIVWNELVNTTLKSGQKVIVGKVLDMDDDGPITKVHVAEPGDTIYKISRLYGVSVTEILEWNNKEDFSISVGEKITIKK